MTRILFALVAAVSVFSLSFAQAFAFECVVANKPIGAGSVATVNVDTGALTPNKPNWIGDEQTLEHPHGGFVTLTGTFGGTDVVTFDTFVHGPTKAQAPFAEPGVIPGASQQTAAGRGCDGKGLDDLGVCLGG